MCFAVDAADLIIVLSWSIGAIDNIACDKPCMEHVVQLDNVTSHSRTMDVMSAQGPLSAQGPEPDRLETLLGVRNDAWKAPLAKIDNRSGGSAASTHTRMSTIVSRFASGLCGIAMLPLAHANSDESAETGLMSVSSGSGMIVRSYGAAQLMRDNPVMGTVALITTTALVCGSVFGLLRSSGSTDSPSAESLNSLGATTMSTCRNLIDEIKDLHRVTYNSPLISELEAIDGWADGLTDKVECEINAGTQAPSLESLLECIDEDLKEGALKTLRTQIGYIRTRLERGVYGVDDLNHELLRTKFDQAAALADSIDAKMSHAMDQITAEISRQRARSLPRIG